MRIKSKPFTRRGLMKGAAILTGAGMGFGTPLFARAETVLKMNLPVGPTDPMSVTSVKFAEIVEKNSGGALRIQIFYNGTLGKQQASITGVQNGVIDLTLQTTAWLEPLAPRVQAFDLPFAFNAAAAAERVLDGDIGRQLSADLAEKGVLVLAWGTNGWRDLELVSTRVTKPEDMRGLKIRIQSGPVYVSMMKALGAVPVVLDISELYLALQQKVVEGLEIPPPTVLSLKYEEVVKYVALTHHLYNAAPIIMSKVKYDTLPADHKKALQDASGEILPFWRDTYERYQKEALETLRNKGLTVDAVDHEAFRRAMTPVYDELRQKNGADFVERVLHEAA
jgi:TRAP-type transport system periplasmic protein